MLFAVTLFLGAGLRIPQYKQKAPKRLRDASGLDLRAGV